MFFSSSFISCLTPYGGLIKMSHENATEFKKKNEEEKEIRFDYKTLLTGA